MHTYVYICMYVYIYVQTDVNMFFFGALGDDSILGCVNLN